MLSIVIESVAKITYIKQNEWLPFVIELVIKDKLT